MRATGWASPRDLLGYLDACDVRLLCVVDWETNRRKLSLWADPRGALDLETYLTIGEWEADIIALLDERRNRPEAPAGCRCCPDFVIFEYRAGRWAALEPP